MYRSGWLGIVGAVAVIAQPSALAQPRDSQGTRAHNGASTAQVEFASADERAIAVPVVDTDATVDSDHGPLKRTSAEAVRPESLNLLPWALLIGGAAALAAAGVTGALALRRAADLEAQCGPDRACPANLQDEADSRQTLATVSDILLTTGVLGVGAGGLWLLLSQGSGERDPTGLAVRASCHLRGCSTEARWIF